MATAYGYTPLPPDTDDIRLLTLQPGDEADEIAIMLRRCSLSTATGRYEALSYVWGSTDNPITIDVRRVLLSGNGRLAVTQNLAVALRHLRSPNVPRSLWIDAICIDQQNVQEKSKQVLRMGDIFRLASRVVIWLGPASSDSDLAIKLLHHQGSMARYDSQKLGLVPTSVGESEPHWADLMTPLPYDETEVRAIKMLLDREWFERLWVVQEATVNPNTLVVCGTCKITTWKILHSAILNLVMKDFGDDDALEEWTESTTWRLLFSCVYANLFASRVLPLRFMVCVTQGHKCSDPRDKVYAVLSLAINGQQVKPDYTLSTMQVYRQFTMACIEYDDFSFLRHCELTSRKLSGPTWIPDWSSPPRPPQIWWVQATHLRQTPATELPDQEVIRVEAVHVGTVGRADKVSIPSSDIGLTVAEIKRLAPAHVENLAYPTGCSLLEAFCGALVALDFDKWWGSAAHLPELETSVNAVRLCLQWVAEEAEGDLSAFPDEAVTYLSSVFVATKHRALISTVEGYIGLGPTFAREGDVIYAVLACPILTILRPVEGWQCRFQVVGECFLYGLSNDKAILGALPGHIRTEHYNHPDTGIALSAYRNVETNEVSLEDPRLLALGIPPGLDERKLPRTVSGNTLEAAGVKLSRIELV